MAKLITASYKSKCFYGDDIMPGQQIVWDRPTGRARHLECHSPVGGVQTQQPASKVEAIIEATPRPTLFDEMVREDPVEIRIVREREANGYDPSYAEALIANARKPVGERQPVARVDQGLVKWAAGMEIPNPRPEPMPRPEPEPTDRAIRDGIYTVVMPEGYRTIRVRTIQDQDNKFFGRTIVSYLSGSDNESDYTGFAFLHGSVLKVWRRYEGNAETNLCVRAVNVLLDKDAAAQAGLAYAIESGRCCRCNHVLTVEASINMGMGPECAKKYAL